MPEPVKKSNIKIAQTRSLHWMEEAHLIMCLAWAIGLVMVIIGDVFWDDTMFWIGVVIWISASCLIFAMRGLACILKCLPKLRVQDSSPTNSRTSDEGTNWTITIVRYKFNHLATKLTTFVAFHGLHVACRTSPSKPEIESKVKLSYLL